MVETIRELQRQQRELAASLRKLTSTRVGSTVLKQRARDLVDYYFRDARRPLCDYFGGETLLLPCDDLMHSLLECTHRRSLASVYKRITKELGSEFVSLEKAALGTVAPAATPSRQEPIDEAILRTLSTLLPSAALSFQQAIADLQQQERYSWRGPATDLREALRETLDHLAPDKSVMGQPGFKLEKDTRGPTMKQKVRYILRSRGASRLGMEAPESAVQAVDEAMGTFVRSVYTRSSVSTHTPTDKREVLRVRDLVRVALSELLELRA